MQGGAITLPPFTGATRRIVILYVATFFALAILTFALGNNGLRIEFALALQPIAAAHGRLWELLTYTFVPGGLLNTVFALLTIWFCGSSVEEVRGSRWITELFYISVIGGAIITTLLSLVGIPQLPSTAVITGAWGAGFAMLVAFGILFAEQEMLFFFVIRMKAKYLIAIYVLIDLAMMFKPGYAPNALMQLACGLCAYIFLRYAPRRGMAFGFSEQIFGIRNGYYRWKRRRAARKFEVYMRKQNREVHFDEEGRYISPDEERRDPKNGKWMN